MKNFKRYSKQWFHRFFSRIEQKGELGRVALENKCALWHIGVRKDSINKEYSFPNDNVRRKFAALCRALGVSEFRVSRCGSKTPNYQGVYYINDRGDLINRLK